MLYERFSEPKGFCWGKFKDRKGANIRYGYVHPRGKFLKPNANKKGTMVIVTGFRECIEKYFEVINDMTDRGFSVWIMDWRGQGGSDRYFAEAPEKMHSNGYKENVKTLHEFVKNVVKDKKSPLILTAHSMGGNIAMRYLRDYAGVFDAAILTAPMFGINIGGAPNFAARGAVSFAKSAGYLNKCVPGKKDNKGSDDDFAGNNLTSDYRRFNISRKIYKDNPDLLMGKPTFGWVDEAFRSMDIINDKNYLKEITTPMLMQTSGNDLVVDKKAQLQAIETLENCIHVNVPRAKHEIWMEKDAFRNKWLENVDVFLDYQLKMNRSNGKKNRKNKAPHKPK